MEKKVGRKKAIREKCMQCSNGSTAEVRLCPVKECPLWRYRMGTEQKDTGEDEAAEEQTDV